MAELLRDPTARRLASETKDKAKRPRSRRVSPIIVPPSVVCPDGPPVVVMFSGAAGSSVGARQGGAKVVAGANHNATCVAVHAANFPEAQNIQQDLSLFNHAAFPFHEGLIASPVCRANSSASRPARARAAKAAKEKGHSDAAAAARLASAHNAYGALPWAVMDSLEVNRPRWFVIENVEEWADWVFFADFLRMAKRLGYKVTVQCLNSIAWGVPQERLRLFMVGTLGRKPIRIADPVTFVPASMHDAIDWDGGEWLDFSEAGGEKMCAQLERCHATFGGRPSFINLVGHRPVYDASEPLRTATRQDQFRWVYRGRFKYPTAAEAFRLMGFPDDYVITDHVAEHRTIAWQLAGDAVCPPVMRGIVERVIAAT
jgi:DNA (cytosine-5)-methyltransferase 1